MLEDLGGYETWPQAADIGTWLSETVVPQLEWLVGDRAEKAAAVIDEIAKAAAARNKAEKKSGAKAKVTRRGSVEALSAAVNAIAIRPLSIEA